MAETRDRPSPLAGEGGSAPALPGEGSEALTPHPSRRKRGSPPSPSRGEGSLKPSPLTGEGGSAPALPGEGSFLKRRARSMRREPIAAEKELWYALRNRRFTEWKFRRQVPIGRFIVDFLCFEERLIIEVDGGQHNASADDLARDAWLKVQGYTILRFWNNDVLTNLEGILNQIGCTLATPHPSRRKRGSPPSRSTGEGSLNPSPLAGEGGSAPALPGEGPGAGENAHG